MSNWHSRSGGVKPRFKPMMVAIPLGVFLLFSAITGRVDLIRAFDSDADKIDRLLEQKAVIEATVLAQEATVTSTELALAPLEATPTPESSATATNNSVAGCEASSDGRYCRYTVQEGDSLAAIATRFGLDGGEVPGWQLVFESNKLDLASIDDVLVPGGVLLVPYSNGILHLVLPGDSLSALAQDYDVSIGSIASANGMVDADDVQIGDILLVPSPAQVPAPVVFETLEEEEVESVEEMEMPEATLEPVETPEIDEVEEEPEAESTETIEAEETPEVEETEEPEPEPTSEPEATDDEQDVASESAEAEDPSEHRDRSRSRNDSESATSREDRESDQADAPEDSKPEELASEPAASIAASQAGPDDASSMSWPVVQPVQITNYMTARHPLGLDFGLFANPTSSIMAAAGGTVVFAGGDPCCSYGYYVIVDHGNGLQTLYAHFSSIAVSKGETVSRGQALGVAGATGYAFGVHLHFEVYKDGTRVDPMRYLPGN